MVICDHLPGYRHILRRPRLNLHLPCVYQSGSQKQAHPQFPVAALEGDEPFD